MADIKHTVFVCGATGTQGGAVARQCLALGWTVHAFTRDSTSPAAQVLATAGAKLFTGTWDDSTALSAGLSNCTALFLNLYPAFNDPTLEQRQGETILALAADAGVQHVVYSAGIGAENPEYFQHYNAEGPTSRLLRGKWNIERALHSTNAFKSRTSLRPGGFMANFLSPKVERLYGEFVTTGRLVNAMLPGSRLPLIDHEDIAAFVVAALREPERFDGQKIELAGEILTLEEIMGLLSVATGRDLKPVYMTDKEIEEQKGKNPYVYGHLMMRDMAVFFSIEEVKKWGIPLRTFKQFLEREKKVLEETYNTRA